jgi:hypothetical protein
MYRDSAKSLIPRATSFGNRQVAELEVPIRLLQMNDTSPHGNCDRLGPIMHRELRKNVLNMALHRLFADAEVPGDLFIALSFCD